MSEEGYNLRKRMVPKSPPSVSPPSSPSPLSLSQDTPDIVEGFVHVEMKKVTSTNGDTRTEGGNPFPSEVDEEETVFEQTSMTQPLISRDSMEDTATEVQKLQDESALSIALQVFLPYIVAGFGTVGAGMVLDVVQVSLL